MSKVKPSVDENKKYWSKVRDFNLSRTNIWILLVFQLLSTIIPFLLIWLLTSPDFQNNDFNYYLSFGDQKVGIFIGISFALLVWATLFNLATFFLKLQKADSFTFTCGFIIVFLMILLNGLWQYSWNARTDLKIFIRFLICLVSLVPAMFLGLVITSLFRNWAYRIEEDEHAMLIAYQSGAPVPSKAKLKLDRALKHEQKRANQVAELNAFKVELDDRLKSAYDKHQEKYLAKQAKLDQIEDKKRTKDLKKKQK